LEVLAAHGDQMQDDGAGDRVTDRREQRHRDLSIVEALTNISRHANASPGFPAAERG
jgi:hypothetical protein